jgi:hypothetical protein
MFSGIKKSENLILDHIIEIDNMEAEEDTMTK